LGVNENQVVPSWVGWGNLNEIGTSWVKSVALNRFGWRRSVCTSADLKQIGAKGNCL